MSSCEIDDKINASEVVSCLGHNCLMDAKAHSHTNLEIKINVSKFGFEISNHFRSHARSLKN